MRVFTFTSFEQISLLRPRRWYCLNETPRRIFFVHFRMNIKEIQDKLAKFAEDRDWDQFHSPKNLVMALTSEVGELNDLFQWLTEEQSKNVDKDEMRQEIADIFIYLLRLSDKLDVDIEEAVREKIEINANKYPAELSKGKATKYNKLGK